MGVPFSQIPAGIRLPFFKIEFSGGQAGNQTNQQSVLVGQVTEGTPLVMTYMPSAAVAAATFGAGSMLAAMVRDYRASDPFGTLYVVGVDDPPGGAKAAGSIAFTGTATANGTLPLYVAGQSVPVGVTVGMTAAQLATATVAAIAAAIDGNGIVLPVTAAIDGMHTYQADLTAVHKGLLGNDIDIRLAYEGIQNGEQVPAGITVAIVAMAGGTSEPDLTGLGAALGSANADFIAAPWNDATSLNTLQTMMGATSGRWNFETQTYGHVFSAKKDADSTGATNIAFGQTRNDPHVTIVSFEPGSPTPGWTVAAGFMGAFAVASRANPVRPSQTLIIPAVLAPPPNEQYLPTTQNTLLSDGMALMQWHADKSAAILRSVTTYQFNQWAAPDQSYLDAETLYTLMAVSRQLKADITTAYPRAALADDGNNFGSQLSADPAVNAAICTPAAAKSIIIASYERMMTNDALVQDVDAFEAGLIVERNADDASRLDVLYDANLVSGLRIFAVLNAFYLNTPPTGTNAN